MISTSTPIDIMININIDSSLIAFPLIYIVFSISYRISIYIDIDRGSSIEAPYIDIDSGSNYLQEDRLSILVVPYR